MSTLAPEEPSHPNGSAPPGDVAGDSETRRRQPYFLSYAGVDREAAQALMRGLTAAGLDVWFDVEDLARRKGIHWVRALEEALETSAGYLVVVGEGTLRGWVNAEFEYALGRNVGDPNFRIVPLLLHGVEPTELKGFLKIFQAVQLKQVSSAQLRHWGDADFAQLASNIAASSYRFDESVHPFPGLGCFDEAQAGFFFGRERDVSVSLEPLIEAPKKRRWLQVEGASGAGKSSFARAGVLPAIRRGALALKPSYGAAWDVVVVRPGTAPILNLATQLYHSWPKHNPGPSVGDLGKRLESSPDSLAHIVRERRGHGTNFVLLIDQLEELFTLSEQRLVAAGEDSTSGDQRAPSPKPHGLVAPKIEHFAKLLLGLLDDVDLQVTLITTIRSDFIKHMVGVRSFANALNQHAYRYCLPPLRGVDLEPVIVGPAHRLGLQVEEVVDEIIKDAGDVPSALPLVAHALDLLWRQCDRKRLSLATYVGFGRIKGALTQSAEQLFKAIEHPDRVERLFRGLVRVNRDGTVTRHPRHRAEAVALAGGDQLAEKILHQLSGGTPSAIRLLVVRDDASDPNDSCVDLIHEALIHGSKQVAGWIERDKKLLQRRGDLEYAAERWRDGPPVKSDDGLARGAALAYYEASDLTTDERKRYLADAKAIAQEFLEASWRVAKQSRRRRRWLTLGGVVATLVALAAVVVGWSQSRANDRSRAEQQGRLASAHARVPGQEVVAGLTAVRALGRDLQRADAPAIIDGLSEAAAVASRISKVVESQGTFVLGATFSPDERFVLIFGEAGFCELVELDTAKKLALSGHDDVVWSGAFSKQGNLIVTASSDGTAMIWDLDEAADRIAAGEPRLLAKHTLIDPSRTYLLDAAFSSDGAQVVTAGYGGAAIWSTNTGARIDIAHGLVSHAEFSSTDRWVVSAGNDGRARLWDTRRSSAVAFNAATPLNSARFSTDEAMVATAGKNGSVSVFNVRVTAQNGVERGLSEAAGDLYLVGHEKEVFLASFAPQGERRLLTASADATARIWDLQNGRTICTFSGHGDEVRHASWSPDGRRVATASHDYTARLWDASSCGLLAVYRAHGSWVRSVVFSRDGQRMLTAGWEGEVRLWRTQSGQYEQQLLGHRGPVTDVAWSPQGELATSSMDNTLRLWNLADGTSVEMGPPAKAGADGIRAVAWNGEGRLISAGEDGTGRLWDAKKRQELTVFPHGGGHRLNDVAFSPDNEFVVTGSDGGTVKVWRKDGRFEKELQTRRPEAEQPDAVRSTRFSRDGKRILITCWDPRARIWAWQGDDQVETLEGHNAALYFGNWSPAGDKLITAGTEAIIRNVATPDKPTHTLSLHQLPVQHAVFSPTGDRILTSSRDNTAILWDADGTPLITLRGHGGPVSRAAFSPDGKKVATASDDGSVLIYSLDPADLARTVCSNLERAPEYELPENEDVRATCKKLQERQPASRVAVTTSIP